MNILITGGSGFIGSNFISYLLSEFPDKLKVLNYDNLTYAGQGKNLEHMKLNSNLRYFFVRGDICDEQKLVSVFNDFKPSIVFHFAAESHVDRSLENKNPFERSNVFGTGVLLKVAKQFNLQKFIYISTDEVYGSISNGSFSEEDELHPSNPYANTKAQAEVLVRHYCGALGLPCMITRSANNFGPYQFPEKILSKFITNLIEGKKVPLMWSQENPGLNVRDWLHVKDNCRAIWFISQKGKIGELYNIPGENEFSNIEITKKLLKYFGYDESMIEKVSHRIAHDFRYSVSGKKLKSLGFEYLYKNLDKEINSLCKWYQENSDWWKPLKLK